MQPAKLCLWYALTSEISGCRQRLEAAHEETGICGPRAAAETSAGAPGRPGSAGRGDSRAARWAALDAAGSRPAAQGLQQHAGAEDPGLVTETESEDEEGEGFGGLFAD